jgi:adenosylcobinamide-GDP ribazoletransferase
MILQWRLFLMALRRFTRIPVPWIAPSNGEADAAARYMPLVGAVVGAGAGCVYWLATRLWPTSVAVILAMLATALLTGGLHESGLAKLCAAGGRAAAAGRTRDGPDEPRAAAAATLCLLFVVLLRYNALMALSAANLAFPLPANCALGLIMIAAHMASRALVVSVAAGGAAQHLGAADLSFALVSGFIPAALLGMPGLVGLAAAIVTRMAFSAYVKRRGADHDHLGATQQLTEVAFYLGALSAWTYI